MNPALGHLRVFEVELDQDRVAAETTGYQAHGAAAAEGIENNATDRAPRLDARLDQLGRERGEVGIGICVGRDRPDVAQVRAYFGWGAFDSLSAGVVYALREFPSELWDEESLCRDLTNQQHHVGSAWLSPCQSRKDRHNLAVRSSVPECQRHTPKVWRGGY